MAFRARGRVAARAAALDAFDAYLDWRAGAQEVWEAYRHWAHAETAQAPRAFGAYVCALNREQAAADAYAAALGQITGARRLTTAAPLKA